MDVPKKVKATYNLAWREYQFKELYAVELFTIVMRITKLY
jgi:hypothetical protein